LGMLKRRPICRRARRRTRIHKLARRVDAVEERQILRISISSSVDFGSKLELGTKSSWIGSWVAPIFLRRVGNRERREYILLRVRHTVLLQLLLLLLLLLLLEVIELYLVLLGRWVQGSREAREV
jgi:hypothetical protein